MAKAAPPTGSETLPDTSMAAAFQNPGKLRSRKKPTPKVDTSAQTGGKAPKARPTRKKKAEGSKPTAATPTAPKATTPKEAPVADAPKKKLRTRKPAGGKKAEGSKPKATTPAKASGGTRRRRTTETDEKALTVVLRNGITPSFGLALSIAYLRAVHGYKGAQVVFDDGSIDEALLGDDRTVVAIGCRGGYKEHDRKAGRKVGPFAAIIEDHGSAAQKKVGKRALAIVRRFGGDIDEPKLAKLVDEGYDLLDASLIGAWFAVRSAPVALWEVKLRDAFRNWFTPQVGPLEAQARVASMMRSESTKAFKGRGVASSTRTNALEREQAFSRMGRLFLVEVDGDKLQRVYVAKGPKSGVIEGSFQVLAGRKEERIGTRTNRVKGATWRLGSDRASGSVVFYLARGKETELTLAEFTELVMGNF